MGDKLLSYQEVAERLNVSVWTVRAWAKKGEIRVMALGEKTHRISETELNEFLKRKEE